MYQVMSTNKTIFRRTDEKSKEESHIDDETWSSLCWVVRSETKISFLPADWIVALQRGHEKNS